MNQQIKAPKKLIEVALPLDAINAESAREKSIRHGHPSTLHLWWARRPLATARAVIFGQMVNDPSWRWEMEHAGEVPPNHLKASWAKSRNRLFAIIRDLVLWANTTNEEVLERARVEIRKSWRETCDLNRDHPHAADLFDPDRIPGLHDPFAGGGAIPLEAQRLGLQAFASDLNPVAVLINKAMIEIPPKFAGRPPIGPIDNRGLAGKFDFPDQWAGAAGLAEDIRRYGAWMRDEAQQRVGYLYPPIEITLGIVAKRPDLKPLVGEKLTIIASLWARTVKSPSPAYRDVFVPLATSFILSKNEGSSSYVQPHVTGNSYTFDIEVGHPPESAENGTKLSRGANFRCLLSGTPIEPTYIKSEAVAGRMGARLMAVVAESRQGRVYLPPTEAIESAANQAQPDWKPELKISGSTQYIGVKPYGLDNFSQLFNNRQLVTLGTFSSLVEEARARVFQDALAAGLPDDGEPLATGGTGASAYADAISVYLAFAVSKETVFLSSLARWRSGENKSAPAFGRQAIAMVWDYADLNPFAGAGGDFFGIIQSFAKVLENGASLLPGEAEQLDATTQSLSAFKVISTDPPYYDNVPYADLSDYFYVWLRRSLKEVYPDLFATLAVPKTDELVAFAYRHDGKSGAEAFFLDGMTRAMRQLATHAHGAFPVTIYYAFKQADSDASSGTASTGWETFLDAVVKAGFALTGTWPMRTEGAGRLRAMSSNALASSIVLVCRPRGDGAATISRRSFIRELNQVLPEALDEMTRGSGEDRSPVAPVDLSQAIIGPGMAVFSKYTAVLEADGSAMTVQTALRLINRFLAEDDFDADTQFCLHWFEQHGWEGGKFGDADTLARAKGTAVDGVKQAGVVYSAGGIVRLLKWAEYPSNWNPETDTRLPVWEALHQLVRVVRTEGEAGAGAVLAAVATKAEATRQLAYRLYTLCERAGWAEDARAYNELITSWSAIESAAAKVAGPKQASLFDQA
ncbi:DUF1156 domain-containing protein [Rhizobium leguminosarum]|uniref:DUF1156 domain-containing protein n=1 Tax=Rhizobium ruizarguesonis TaxID=2081791 RepID=UPI0013C9CFAE|nr:DUF1156 domain-containing protein [Rhizobium ruizarguesonis]NEJ60792.1 DUF1156 domain-containing protein [Rhizobium ruizarguesonis]